MLTSDFNSIATLWFDAWAVSGFETIVALGVFAGVALLLRRRVLQRIERFVQRRFRTARLWFARQAKVRGERAAACVAGKPITRIRTIDGDTIDDVDSAMRYRIANIDCPETDDRAACCCERIKGEQAKCAAAMIFATARLVDVRPVGRIDRYGRTVACVRVDDRDYGRLMIEKGFAVAWGGKRGKWCGENGGLARLAIAASAVHHCKTCGAGGVKRQTPEPANQRVLSFPIRDRRTDASSGGPPTGT